MEPPERGAALLRRANHCVTDPFRSHTHVGDVDELEAGNAGPDVFFDQPRLNLSRDTAAVRSKRIAVFDDQHRRVGIADDVSVDDQSITGSAADSFDVRGFVCVLSASVVGFVFRRLRRRRWLIRFWLRGGRLLRLCSLLTLPRGEFDW